MTAPEIFMEIANEFFDGQCRVTRTKVRNRGFAIHHIRYLEEGEVERKMYPATPAGTINYYKDLRPLIEEEPDRFALITNGVHRKLDGYRVGICRYKPETRQRFCDLAMETVPHKAGRKPKR